MRSTQRQVRERRADLVAEAEGTMRDAAPEDVLAWALDTFHPRVALASSFGLEDVVLLDMAFRLRPDVRVFTLDTGRLPEETYAVAEAFRQRGVRIEWYFPDREAVEALLSAHGPFSFRRSIAERHACCEVRKLEPLRRALSGLDAWVTGLRREQNVTRAGVEVVELDEANGGLVKVNPLAAWTEADVWAYVRRANLPYNALHDRGYPSVGCAPCTRPVEPGAHPRSGRWWWEEPEHRECGLHLRPPSGDEAWAGTRRE